MFTKFKTFYSPSIPELQATMGQMEGSTQTGCAVGNAM